MLTPDAKRRAFDLGVLAGASHRAHSDGRSAGMLVDTVMPAFLCPTEALPDEIHAAVHEYLDYCFWTERPGYSTIPPPRPAWLPEDIAGEMK